MSTFFYNIRKKFTKTFCLSIFMIVYFTIFWFMFFTKGIFINEHFYKKSANLNTITYSAFDVGCEFDKIVLQKKIDKTIITVDDKYIVTVFNNNDIVYSSDEKIDIDWKKIATQKGETIRKLGKRPWPLAIIFAVLFFVVRKYNSQIYSFVYKNKVAGEKYYKYFDIIFSIFCIFTLIYLILPI